MGDMATLERTRGAVQPETAVLSDGPELRFGWRLPTMTVRDVIQRHGHFAHAGTPYATAEAWVEAGDASNSAAR